MTGGGSGEADGWQRLGRCVRERRNELGLTQAEVYAAGGPSPATLYLLESGQRDSYRPRLLRGLERAMGWQAHSITVVLAGGKPVVQPDGAAAPPPAEPPVSAASVSATSLPAWLAGFRQLPLTPQQRVRVLVRLLDEAAAELDDGAAR